MPGQRPILAMSFVASVGITLETLACLLPKHHGNFWPSLILIFYLLLPVPLLMVKRITKNSALGSSDPLALKRAKDFGFFFTAGVLISSVALPLILARSPAESPLIAPISCVLVELGNALCLLTIALFCIYFKPFKGF